MDYRLARCADRTLRSTPRASRNVYLQDLQSELPERTAELIEQTALLVGVDEETVEWCKKLSRQNTKSFSNFITSKNSLTRLLDFFDCYKINPELLREKFLLGVEMLRPKKPTLEAINYRREMRGSRIMSGTPRKKVIKVRQSIDAFEDTGEFFFSEVQTKE
ncbi:hypothetical protein KA013_02925 [Patescibacteria group bacterium]|nr:hypothetical protein [Patescibacteria group bacterium]